MLNAFLTHSLAPSLTSGIVGRELARRLRLAAESRLWLPGKPMLLLSRRPSRGASTLSVDRVDVLRSPRFEFFML
jgi:hypothetical protein